MKNKPLKLKLKLKLLLIFSFPLLAFFYLSYFFIQSTYKELDTIRYFKFSTTITSSLNDLLHELQIERGLSSGYLAGEGNILLKEKLRAQHTKTDEAIENLYEIVGLQQDTQISKKNASDFNAKPIIKKILSDLANTKNIRERVLKSQISFDDEILFYNNINRKLITAIKVFNTTLRGIEDDAISIVMLQQLKEYAGQERAYTYNQLLSNSYDDEKLLKTRILLDKQNDMTNKFFENASSTSSKIFVQNYNDKIMHFLEAYREGTLAKTMGIADADIYFMASTQYINLLSDISKEMLYNYTKKTNTIYKDSLFYLYITAIACILSFIAIFILAYLLIKLVKKEEKNTEELRIASYAFESHEAMTITNLDGTIIKVNSAFTDITGYSAAEIIGKNPRLLKSKHHNDDFFKIMWEKLLHDGRWQGEIYNKRKNGEIYPEMLSITAIKDEDNITTHYIGQFFDISEIKEAKDLAQYQANHDFLTSLLNRRSLISRLNEEFKKAKRHHLVHAFLFIDLDGFKSINDNYGHDAGDKLIKETANRIKTITRQEDIIARISGDEFGVILVNIGQTEAQAAKAVQQVCRKILDTISQEYLINENKIHMTLSIGIKIFPDTENNIEDIMIHADKAMYKAKKMGRNKFVFFNTEIENELKEFTLLEKEIKESIQNKDFIFYYQPKVDAQRASIVGAELLVRWMHPRRGLLFPDSFIDVSEEIGVTHHFSTLAIENACKFINSNKEIFTGSLAINISSHELLHPKFETKITSIISKYNTDPSRIELEITESMVIDKFDLVIKKIKYLQEFGVKFSIDDFGTGYSSITYLQKLPVNTLKIDREFLNISEKSNKELVKMMVNIAKTFKMHIVAEGIETKEHLEFIKKIGIESYQGFFFSKAVDEQRFKKLLLN